MNYGAIILAAGDGKRMQSDLPKVLHKLAGNPILHHCLATTFNIPVIKQVVVVGGIHIDALQSACASMTLNNKNIADQVVWAHQKNPRGTADAVAVGLLKIVEDIENVLILSGDVPLISTNTLNQFITSTPKEAIGIITANVELSAGLGRIIRDKNNNFKKIIEESDANELEKQITEINSGIYIFPKKFLTQYLSRIDNNNSQQEYYLPDVLKFAVEQNIFIHTEKAVSQLEIMGVNTRKQLAALEREYQLQQAVRFLEQGVAIIDPNRFDVRGDVEIARDVEIDINVILVGKVVIGNGTKIGANCYIKDTIIGNDVIIQPNSMIDGAFIQNNAAIGPFARIRPKTNIAANAKIGNFVEIKAAIIGEKSKINHLSYIGDAKIGSNVNIGAGTITCNYDGANKHLTVIEDEVFIGSGCQLIAPIVIAKHATLAAGTTLISNAPPSELTLNKKIQYSVEWHRPNKETPSRQISEEISEK